MSNESKKKVTHYLRESTIKALDAKIRTAEKVHGESSRLVDYAVRKYLGMN